MLTVFVQHQLHGLLAEMFNTFRVFREIINLSRLADAVKPTSEIRIRKH